MQTTNKARGKGFSKQLNKGGGAEPVGSVVTQVVSPAQSVPTFQKPPCPVCEGDHHTYFCSVFLGKTMDQKQEVVSDLKLCRNCLKIGHSAAACRSDYRCRTCRGKHNTALHFENNHTQVNTAAAIDAVVTVAGSGKGKVPSSLLMTCKILVTNPSGKSVVATQ